MSTLLPRLIATLTNHPRQLVESGVDFEWSNNSWVHNLFRSFELFFGRREGIRLEMSSYPDGNGGTIQYAHTFEAALALLESTVRSKLPVFEKIYLPQLVPVGMPVPSAPFYFAIAFDASSSNSTATSQTCTFSHTCTGSNLTLVIGAESLNVPAPVSNSATYNGASATSIINISDGSNNSATTILFKTAPATGANNIIVSSIDAVPLDTSGYGLSFTGTDQTQSGGGTSSTGLTHSNAPTQGFTTNFANSWIIDNVIVGGGVGETTTGTNQTSRVQFSTANANRILGSSETTTTTGSYTTSWSLPVAKDWVYLAAELQVSTASATVLPFRALLGVGK